MRFPQILALAALPIALVVAASPASANCARPVGYDAAVTGNTVKVEPVNFDARACPDADGMLRQTVSTGEIVKLADFCQAGNELAAYVDECVPAGTYRYGFAKAYECAAEACDTSYFVEATVTDTLAADCARSDGNAAPAAATSVPWKDDAVICSYQEGPCPLTGGDCGTGGGSGTTSSSSSTSSGGTGGDGGGTDGASQGSSGGCSVAITPGAGSVIGANVLALIVGLALMRRRRNPQP
jgi:MYXO-CTERM domain-containing protein